MFTGAGKVKSTVSRRQPRPSPGARVGRVLSLGFKALGMALSAWVLCFILATSQHSTNGWRVVKSVVFGNQTDGFIFSHMPLPGGT